MFLQAVHMLSTPERNLKALLSRLQHEDGLHSDQMKTRVAEMRTPEKKAHKAPDLRLKTLFDEAMYSMGSVELLAALKLFKSALLQAYRAYLDETKGLADYASVLRA